MHNPISTNVKRALVNHAGSLCLGSLIIAIVTVIRIMIDILYKSLKKKAQQQGHGLSCLMMCCLKYARCCVGCFEKFIRFINENAYIMIALSGQGFCRSAYEAFYLIVRNAAQFAVTHLIGKIFCFFGACFITATSTAIGYYIITSAEPYKSHIFSPAFPTIVRALSHFART